MKDYIRGVDGLRAIAVVAVVVFHAFPSALRGGFVGVDVFFVISGFIITTTYFTDLATRRVTLGTFFAKRVRRLAPIYLVVLFLTTIASCVLLIPIQLRHFAESLVAQPVYLQNIVFWHHGDYFEQALSKPLLHTWSLAVEEQFYLAYALLVLVARRARRYTLPLLVGGAVLSFGLGWVLSSVSPKTAFYWLPTRVWQMALGVLVALAVPRAQRTPGARYALVVGLPFVVWSILGFDEHARFPGPQSVLACVGTALALVSLATGAFPAALRVLAHPVPTRIGKLSYSLYLWHWPFIALLATALGRPLRVSEGALAIVATLACSWIGYERIERPVRSGRLLPRDRQLFVVAGIGAAITIGVALLVIVTDGATFRYRPDIASMYLAQQQRSPFRCPSLGRLAHPRDETCKLNEADAPKNVMVLGDSHADVLDEMIAGVAAEDGLGTYMTKRDCKLYDFGSPARPDCGEGVLDELRAEIRARHIGYVFAMAFTHADFAEQEALEANAAKLTELVDHLWLLQVVPNDASFDPIERARLLRAGLPPREYAKDRYAEDNAMAFAALHSLAARNPKVSILDPSPLLCPTTTCERDTAGIPNYFDAHHLSPTGASRLAPLFRAALAARPQ